jgi:hypothetical protein
MEYITREGKEVGFDGRKDIKSFGAKSPKIVA